MVHCGGLREGLDRLKTLPAPQDGHLRLVPRLPKRRPVCDRSHMERMVARWQPEHPRPRVRQTCHLFVRLRLAWRLGLRRSRFLLGSWTATSYKSALSVRPELGVV